MIDPQKPKEEIGATAGKTHDEVIDGVVGRERRVRNQAKGGAEPDDASR